ncbi:hypothetical protein FT663_01544 [Candidozyma haemuli var. vulneris]|nr:hypothetical protein FT662_02122 [[Candida] haemuloni var. vulneris]KAF3994313.1 hypothetical protein FT663_01544 [[Candida] haemuloni var. vulneris]
MAPKRSKNQLRREKAKLRKLQSSTENATAHPEAVTKKHDDDANGSPSLAKPEADNEQTKETSIVPEASEKIDSVDAKPNDKPDAVNGNTKSDVLPLDEDLASDFQHVFRRFEEPSAPKQSLQVTKSNTEYYSDSSSDDSSDEEFEKPLSRRQQRLRNKVSIAELKASTDKPNAVAWYDADAPDPYLCVAFKTSFNAVGVPSHWSQKKDYLSGKKGFEVPPFRLPKYIQDTGIAEMRNYDPDTLKKQQRERVQPKMGKLDIDYQKLHDAFFKFQTKPRHLKFGELYWEGREKSDQYRESVTHMRPGVVSKRLREAVGLSSNDTDVIPPWVTLMNSVGKPPAFKNCIIPGVDVIYDNGGYRTSDSQGLKINEGHTWGAFEADMESEYEDEDEDDEEDEEETSDQENQESDINDDHVDEADEAEKVDITEFSRYKTDNKPTNEEQSHGSLYKVLKERDVSTSKDTGERKAGYDLADHEANDDAEQKSSSAAQDQQDNVDDFEF